MQEVLKQHAITSYRALSPYFRKILEGFPEEKMNEKVGSAQSPMELMKHIVGTPGWWMKQRGTRLPFSSSIQSAAEFFEILERQRFHFEKLLDDSKEIYWKSSTDDKPKLSVPWIMIRSFHHALHHGAMLIQYRHFHGLPPIQFDKGMHWGDLVDIAGNMVYGNLG